MPHMCFLGCPSEVAGHLHVFPNPKRFPEQLKKWVEIVGGQLNGPDDCELYRRKRLCDRHFTQRDKNRNNRLNALAVPSLFLRGVTVHSFPQPSKFPERFRAWVSLAGSSLEGLSDEDIYYKKKVCDLHFTNNHRNRNNRINAIAMPVLLLPNGIKKDEPPKNTEGVEGQHNFEEQLNEEIVEDDFQQMSDCITKDEPPKHTVPPENIRLPNFEDQFYEDIVEDDFQQMPEEAQTSGEFSWQRASAVVPGDADIDDAECPAEAQMFPAPPPPAEPLHEGYRCNACQGTIVGFRYVCVQCVDFDLCGACEAAGQHPHHYAVRVPGPRPQSEVAKVLHAIRQALLAECVLPPDSLQTEVKEELEEPDPISVQEEASDGEDCETVDDAASGAPGAGTSDEDSYVPSDTDSDGTDHTYARKGRHKKTKDTTVVDAAIPSHSQAHSESTSSTRSVKRPPSKPVCFFDLKKNTIVVLGSSTSDTKPATLRRQPTAPTNTRSLLRHENKTLTVKRTLTPAQALSYSKRARVTLERLREDELHTALAKR